MKSRKVIMVVEQKWLGYVLRNLFAIKGVKVFYSDSTLEQISLRNVKASLARSAVLILDVAGRGQKMIHKLIRIREKIPEAETICVSVNKQSEFRSIFRKARVRNHFAPQDSLGRVYGKIRRILAGRIRAKEE